MTEFKSFADFKRRVTHMTMVKSGWWRDGEFIDQTANEAARRVIGVKREVVKINTVDILLATAHSKTGVSHLPLRKASDWSFDGDTVTYDDGGTFLQYKVEARES